MTDKLIVSWDEYHQLIERLAKRIQQSEWRFEAIVTLARGGLRVGDTLSRLFNVPMAVWFASSYRAQAGTQQETLYLGEHIASAQPITAERILLVDDLVDSGQTLQVAEQMLPARLSTLKELRTAVLWVKPRSCVQPDYAACVLQNNAWIVQPFERDDR